MRTRSHKEAGKETRSSWTIWTGCDCARGHVTVCLHQFGILPALPDGTNSIKPDTPEDRHLLSARTCYRSLATRLTDNRKHHIVPFSPLKTFIYISNSCWCLLYVLLTWSWADARSERTAVLQWTSVTAVCLSHSLRASVRWVTSSKRSATPRRQLIIFLHFSYRSVYSGGTFQG